MKRLDDIIVVKYQKYIVIKREQAQNAIRLLVQNANDQVSKMNRVILFYSTDINVKLAIRRETIKNTFDSASTFGRKIQNDLLKMKLRDVN